MRNSLIIGLVAAIVFGAGGFFAGMKYQQGRRPAGFANFQGRFGNGTANANTARPISGQIASVDANGITVKMRDGSSKVIVLSGSTSISQATSATKDALKSGEEVLVLGTTNSDGSVTATNISINPGFPGGPTPSATP